MRLRNQSTAPPERSVRCRTYMRRSTALTCTVHELSVCQALLTQVAGIAADRGASAVRRVVIEIGPLCGVEPSLLAQAFAVLRVGGCAAAAELSIESTPVRIGCLSCGAESHTVPNRLVCAECGGYRTRIIAGDEMRLRRVELRVPEPRPASAAL